MSLLQLFERTDGPYILEDFEEDAPGTDEDLEVLSCPVRFDEEESDASESDPLRAKFVREIQAMRPWYDMALKKRGRTTMSGSNINIDSLGEFIYEFADGGEPDNPRNDIDPSVALKLAVEDLKAYYVEAITAQPGQEGLSSKALKDWFWNETAAGEVLLALVKTCSQSKNEGIKMTGTYFLAPMDVVMKQADIKREFP